MNNENKKEDLNLTDLDNFYCTSKYYNFMGVNITDGVKYLCDNGYFWAVSDAVVILKMKGGSRVDFKFKDKSAVAVYYDENMNIIFKQKYGYTNGRRDFTLYFLDNVLMLSSEY